MKTLLLLLLLPCFAGAQPVALLDRNYKKPVFVTKIVSKTQLLSNRFPIYIADVNAVIRLMDGLVQQLNTDTVHPAEMQLLPAGQSQLAINTQLSGGYNTYTVFLSTRCGELGATLDVVKPGTSVKRALEQLLLFLDYLKNNRHLLVP